MDEVVEKNQPMFDKKYLFSLIIPLMIDQALALSVGLLDTIMVSRVGESAVSGVSLVETINVLIINLFAALATGGAIVAGQYLGRGDRENGRHAAKQLINATALISILITVICLLLNGPMLSLFFGRIEPDMMRHARSYFYVTSLSFPFIALFSSAAALFRSMGNSKLAMANAFIMNAVNIAGNAFFIYVMNLEAFGAGLATLLSRMIAAVSMMCMLRSPNLPISVSSYGLRDTNIQMIKRIMRIGIPAGLENSFFQIGKIILTSLVATMGTTAVAANAVGFSLAGISVVPGVALGLAMTTVVAQCTGAKEYGQAGHYTKYLMKIAYIYMFIHNIALIIFLKPILSLYRLSPETFSLALKIALVHGIGAIFIWTPSFTLPNALRAAGDVKFTMLISMLTMGIFRVGLCYMLAYAFGLGALSVWIAMTVDWTVRSACFISRFHGGRWKGFELI